MRGRKGNPAAQAAKGYPGKRRTKADKILADGAERADSLAVAGSAGEFPISPPAFLERHGSALKFWRDYAPLLAQIHSLQRLDVPRFAMLCVSYDQWLEATNKIRADGAVRLVKTVSGDRMERLSPWVIVEDRSFRRCQELFEQFGIGAMDRAKLLRDRAALPAGLWAGGSDRPVALASGDAPAPRQESLIGAMDGFDTPAPTGRIN